MNNLKKFLTENKRKVALTVGTAIMSFPMNAFASTPDIATTMTTALEKVVTDSLGAIAAVAPIGITIFGATFAWKKGVQFFSQVAKK